MVKHIVLWKVKNGIDKNKAFAEIKTRLENLKTQIEEIEYMEVGRSFNSNSQFDLCLYSVFADERGLEKYQVHPEHVKVVEFISSLVDDRKVIDYVVQKFGY